MNDPIADIIIEQPWKSECTEKRDGIWYCVMNQQQLSDYAKQIRQKIGLELLEYKQGYPNADQAWWIKRVREVCQIDSDKKTWQHCERHGGFGFIHDCVECAKECAMEDEK